MLGFKTVKWIFIFVFLVLLAGVITGLISWYYLVIALVLYISFNFIQSFRIRANYYIKANCMAQHTLDKIALTFDDGPDTKTLEIMDMLDAYNAKACFFIIGKKVEQYPEIVKEIDKRGHIIGNHSYKHNNLCKSLSVRSIKNEIEYTNQLIKQIIHKEPAFFRPPYGVTNPLIAKAIKSFSMDVIGWSIRSFDTLNKKNMSLAKVKREISSGKIILLHDTSPDILWLLQNILEHLKENGYELCSVGELFALEPYKSGKQ